MSGTQNYIQFCQKAAEDDFFFQNFKRSPIYRIVLEHVTYKEGTEYATCIQKEYPDLLSLSEQFRENDLFGNPLIFDFGPWGYFSPTTLRYMKVAGDLRKEFGDLSQFHIIEIGGGYGGQCKILSELTGFSSYTIIDLPTTNALTRKYLDKLGVENVYFIDQDHLENLGTYDLLISNYAFSEVEREEQVQYLRKVLNPTPNGYMTGNFNMTNFAFPFLSLNELTELLKRPGRVLEITPERPQTGKNHLLIWKRN